MDASRADVQRSFGFVMVLKGMRNLAIALVLFLIVGNVAIFVAFQALSRSASAEQLPHLPTIENLWAVDDGLWRGSAPGSDGYAALAENGVTTIVDLRAEDLVVDEAHIESLGMSLVRIPLRDGQTPTDAQVDEFLAVMRRSEGRVYLHCGAGVGRTGTLAAAYLVNSGQASSFEAVIRNLSVGPPSLEQIAFAASIEAGQDTFSNPLITVLSRVLDSPRRLLVRVRDSYGG
jgi:protein-tyrosine phosphatase